MNAPEFNKQLELTAEQFQAWAEHLDPQDTAEFVMLGGDDALLRFICAIDYLTLQKVSFKSPDEMFVMAYWIAVVYYEPTLDLEAVSTRNRAYRAWKSDAVQALYERVRYRSVRQGSIRVQNRLFAIAEAMADRAEERDATFDQMKDAADVLIKIAKLVDTQEQAVRSERTKKGLAAARDALSRGMEMGDRELGVMLKAARNQLGTERFKALLSGLDTESPTS